MPTNLIPPIDIGTYKHCEQTVPRVVHARIDKPKKTTEFANTHKQVCSNFVFKSVDVEDGIPWRSLRLNVLSCAAAQAAVTTENESCEVSSRYQ